MTPKPVSVQEGSQTVAIVATGSVLAVALETYKYEKDSGREPPTVFSMPWLNPIDQLSLDIFSGFKLIVCIEEHIREGGLQEILSAKLPRSVEITGIGIQSDGETSVGSQNYLRNLNGLTVNNLKNIIQKFANIS
jgi:transketolase C-terminal domain/subunit